MATVVLPVPGLPRERHVQRRALGAEPDLGAEPVDQQQRRDLADARLDRRERDQLAVELVEHLVEPFVARGLRIRATSAASATAASISALADGVRSLAVRGSPRRPRHDAECVLGHGVSRPLRARS